MFSYFKENIKILFNLRNRTTLEQIYHFKFYFFYLCPKDNFIFIKIIALDIGNHSIKWGCFENDLLVENGSLKSIEELCTWAKSTAPQVNHIVCSSVTQKLYNNEGKSILSEIFPNIPVLSMDEKMIINQKLPISINYKSPNTLGTDRVAGVCGARLAFPNKNILVIDVGTCITYDFMDKKNVYHGGAISLGLNMRAKAMHHFTANLPLVDFDNFVPKIKKNSQKATYTEETKKNEAIEDNFDTTIMGFDTNSCLESGSFFGMVYEIRGFIDSFVRRKKVQQIIVTGGHGEILLYYLNDNRVIYDANIVLKGLVNILLHNA